ncbi:MAG: DUF7079 family protein [Rhodanobacter sp.]
MNEASRASPWDVFLELLWDIDLADAPLRRAARFIKPPNLAPAEAEATLCNEVFPVLHNKWLSVADEWTGWSPAWLRLNLHPTKGPARRTTPRSVGRKIERCWCWCSSTRPAGGLNTSSSAVS